MIQPPFSSAIAAQPCHVTFLTTKTVVRKNQENLGQMGSRAWTRQCFVQGGYFHWWHFQGLLDALHAQSGPWAKHPRNVKRPKSAERMAPHLFTGGEVSWYLVILLFRAAPCRCLHNRASHCFTTILHPSYWPPTTQPFQHWTIVCLPYWRQPSNEPKYRHTPPLEGPLSTQAIMKQHHSTPPPPTSFFWPSKWPALSRPRRSSLC